jgi:hypothetical protein
MVASTIVAGGDAHSPGLQVQIDRAQNLGPKSMFFQQMPYTKKTRRQVFLEEMEQVVPWRGVCALIEPLLFVRRSHLAQPTLSSCGKEDLIQTLPKTARVKSNYVGEDAHLRMPPEFDAGSPLAMRCGSPVPLL